MTNNSHLKNIQGIQGLSVSSLFSFNVEIQFLNEIKLVEYVSNYS